MQQTVKGYQSAPVAATESQHADASETQQSRSNVLVQYTDVLKTAMRSSFLGHSGGRERFGVSASLVIGK